MQRPNEDPVPKDDVPWWMKYAGRGLGTVGGGMAIFLGMWNCIGILLGNIDCLLSGMWQMVAGFLVIVIEAPCCCMFIDFVQTLSDWVDKRPYWNRAVFYGGIAIPAVLFCPGLGSLFGSGLIFGTGVIYGMMSLGRKASPEEMRQNASQLVDNAQPIGTSQPTKVPPV